MADSDGGEDEVLDLSFSGKRNTKAPTVLEVDSNKAAVSGAVVVEGLDAINLSSNPSSSVSQGVVADMGSTASNAASTFMMLGTPRSLMSTMADRGTPFASHQAPSMAATPHHLTTASHKPSYPDVSSVREETEEEEGQKADPNAFRLKIEAGEELLVPTDCDLLTALTSIGSGGRVLVEPSTQHGWEGCVNLRADGLCIRGVRNQAKYVGEAERLPVVRGRWALSDGGSGVIEGLELENPEGEEGVLSVFGGEWVMQDCLRAKFRGFDVAVHCSGGLLEMSKCRMGGFGHGGRCSHGLYITKGGRVRVSDSTLCYCYGSAVEVRDQGRVELELCEIKRNDAVLSAGYPNDAEIRLDRNRIYSNGTIWRKSKPKELVDDNSCTDRLGYTVSLFA